MTKTRRAAYGPLAIARLHGFRRWLAPRYRGDMHYWSVWHEAKDFSAYRKANPRFASEFGFQSFTSMKVIESFTTPRIATRPRR